MSNDDDDDDDDDDGGDHDRNTWIVSYVTDSFNWELREASFYCRRARLNSGM